MWFFSALGIRFVMVVAQLNPIFNLIRIMRMSHRSPTPFPDFYCGSGSGGAESPVAAGDGLTAVSHALRSSFCYPQVY